MFPGQVSVGASVSLTVTVKVQALVLPLLSLAVQVTVVTPLLKVEPLGGTQTLVTPGQLSLAVGAAKLTTREHRPEAVLVTMAVGQAMAGASVSLTVTVNVQALVLPVVSLAVQ